jgi:hypothetical protein
MWIVVIAIAMVSALTTAASADDLARLEGRQHGRAFWLNQAWPNPQDQTAGQPKPAFTMTYMDGVAARFHLGSSRDFFAQKLGSSGAPALVATVDHGAPSVELRWRLGE